MRARGEGSVFLRNKGTPQERWVGSVQVANNGGKRERKWYYGHTQAEVLAKVKAAQRIIDQGLPIPAERLTVAQLLDLWLESRTLKDRTLLRYRSDIEAHIKPQLGGIKARALTTRHVRAFMGQLAKDGLSPRSIRNNRATLAQALRFGQSEGYIHQNVAALTDAPPAPDAQIEPLTAEMAAKVLAAVSGHRLYYAYLVALHTGLRQGELLALRWKDVDLDAASLRVEATLHRRDKAWHFDPTKTAKSRASVALTPGAVEALRRRRTQQLEERLAAPNWENKWDLIFTAENGGPVYGPALTRQFQRLLERAELPPMVMHGLRHGTATIMLAQGVPITSVSRSLRHTTIKTTSDSYAHVVPELVRDAAARLGDALGGPG